MVIVLFLWVVLCFYCLFSYPSLLELHYGGKIRNSQTTREWAKETGLLVREAEQRIDAELFLDEYPRWELGAPHQSVILHKMFLHAAEQGQKGSSAKDIKVAHQDPTWRWASLPWNWWDTGPLARRSGIFTTVFICCEGPQVFHLVGPSREGE